MPSAQDIAKQSGLNPVCCGECGNKIKTKDVMDAFFSGILDAVKNGERVIIPGLGTFSKRDLKGRTVESPVLPNGKVEFPDQQILRFRPSEQARRVLNPELHGNDDKAPKKAEPKAGAKKAGAKKAGAKKAGAKKAEPKGTKKADDSDAKADSAA